MEPLIPRRYVLSAVPALGALTWAELVAAPRPLLPSAAADVHETFPSQNPALVREIVGVSHGNLTRVRELVEASPALAKASQDWGFGDWESALGAAAHTGRREIAVLLIEHGARPTLFSAAMLGQLGVVQAFVDASPGVQRIPGPHGITLLSHARAGGDAARDVLAYLESLGDADTGAARQPLSDEDREAYLGRYAFGPGEEDWLEVYLNDRDQLMIRRGKYSGRGLSYVGDHQFRPAGAAAVRIRFAVEGDRATALSVLDPEVIVAATRVATSA